MFAAYLLHGRLLDRTVRSLRRLSSIPIHHAIVPSYLPGLITTPRRRALMGVVCELSTLCCLVLLPFTRMLCLLNVPVQRDHCAHRYSLNGTISCSAQHNVVRPRQQNLPAAPFRAINLERCLYRLYSGNDTFPRSLRLLTINDNTAV